jgi:hypothetical protein
MAERCPDMKESDCDESINLREALLGFIEDCSEHLKKISPYFEGDACKVRSRCFGYFVV